VSEPDVDWEALRAAARDVMTRAYAPYSGFRVGAAGLVDDGRVVAGCNVENAAYGVALCAECGMVSALHAGGGGRLVAVVCVGPDGEAVMPCGRCRQLLWENGGASMLLETARGVVPMTQVLPDAFGPGDLERASG
jgi:cytidine deaminase